MSIVTGDARLPLGAAVAALLAAAAAAGSGRILIALRRASGGRDRGGGARSRAARLERRRRALCRRAGARADAVARRRARRGRDVLPVRSGVGDRHPRLFRRPCGRWAAARAAHQPEEDVGGRGRRRARRGRRGDGSCRADGLLGRRRGPRRRSPCRWCRKAAISSSPRSSDASASRMQVTSFPATAA